MSEWVKLPGLPPKLEARMKQYGIELPAIAATWDRVLVYPLRSADQPDTTAGGIVVPDQNRRRLAAQRGVVVSMGAKAAEQLFSAGIGLGDIVLIARFSHWEWSYWSQDESGRGKREHSVYIVQAGEIAGCEDLKRSYDTGDLWLQVNTQSGAVQVAERERYDPPAVGVGEGV